MVETYPQLGSYGWLLFFNRRSFMKCHRWLPLAVFFVSAGAQAQPGILDSCKTIITDGLREYSITTDSSSYLNSVFDKYCDSSGSTKSSGIGFGLDVVVKAIPIQFSGTYSSNEEAVRNFCRNYSSLSAGRSDKTSYQERIVQRAYESFDQCIALAQTGVVVRHKVRSLTDLDFFVAPGSQRPVTLRGIKTSPNIQCSGQDPNSPNSAAKVMDLSTRIKVKDSGVLNIACTRTGKTDTNGGIIYDEGTVTLFTDVGPNGNYGAFVPRDTRLAENQASVIAQQIASLDQRAATLATNHQALQNQVPTAIAFSCRDTLYLTFDNKFSACNDNEVVSKVMDGITYRPFEHRYMCCSLRLVRQ
jgi:hypothetical protein